MTDLREHQPVPQGDGDPGLSSLRFRIVCAWCQRVLNEGGPGAHVSHGCCDACLSTIDQDLELYALGVAAAHLILTKRDD